MTKDEIEARAREQLITFLPQALEAALKSYHGFMDTPIGEDAKEFTAHHNACKVAIAHIELLLKMARWAEIPTDTGQSDELTVLLSQAEQELEDYKNDHDQ